MTNNGKGGMRGSLHFGRDDDFWAGVGMVYVAAAADGDVVGEELEGGPQGLKPLFLRWIQMPRLKPGPISGARATVEARELPSERFAVRRLRGEERGR
jgi:hypothetical protein